MSQTTSNRESETDMTMTKEQKIEAYEKLVEQRKKHTQRRQAKINLILRKAEKAGITVTEAEIDQELKKKSS